MEILDFNIGEDGGIERPMAKQAVIARTFSSRQLFCGHAIECATAYAGWPYGSTSEGAVSAFSQDTKWSATSLALVRTTNGPSGTATIDKSDLNREFGELY